MNKIPPAWLGRALQIAQHQDKLNAMPKFAKFLHWMFVSWRCECCQGERQRRNYKMKL